MPSALGLLPPKIFDIQTRFFNTNQRIIANIKTEQTEFKNLGIRIILTSAIWFYQNPNILKIKTNTFLKTFFI